ncbi:hypothetical protein TNCV_3827711 [Trichonephila clavipes]|nr:hypothetical protein TNCV_3827711 [Trichonephila clavipes]
MFLSFIDHPASNLDTIYTTLHCAANIAKLHDYKTFLITFDQRLYSEITTLKSTTLKGSKYLLIPRQKQAKGDVDLLIVETVIEESEQHKIAVIIGEDTELLVILIVRTQSHQEEVFFKKVGKGSFVHFLFETLFFSPSRSKAKTVHSSVLFLVYRVLCVKPPMCHAVTVLLSLFGWLTTDIVWVKGTFVVSLLWEGEKVTSERDDCQVIYSQFGLEIHQNDHQARRRFVEWAQNEIAIVPAFHKRILFSDEAHFWLNGYVNKQNCRIWSEANPQVYVETPLHPEKLTVWCALWAGGILLQKRRRPQRYSQW